MESAVKRAKTERRSNNNHNNNNNNNNGPEDSGEEAEGAGKFEAVEPGSAVQRERIAQLEHRYHARLSEAHLKKQRQEEAAEGGRRSASSAQWEEQRCSASVTQQRGKALTTLGAWDGKAMRLWPEEALWMLDHGKLKLTRRPEEGAEAAGDGQAAVKGNAEEEEGEKQEKKRHREEDSSSAVNVTSRWLYRRLFCSPEAHFPAGEPRVSVQHFSTFSFLRRLGYVVRRWEKTLPCWLLHGKPELDKGGATVAKAGEEAEEEEKQEEEEGGFAPLVSDVRALDVPDVYERVRIVSRRSEETELGRSATLVDDGWIVYNVWIAEGASSFKKSAPPPPQWRVVTYPVGPGEPTPPDWALTAICRLAGGENIKVRLALVDYRGGKPSFLDLIPVRVEENASFVRPKKHRQWWARADQWCKEQQQAAAT